MKTKYARDGMYLMNGDVIVKSVNLPDNADPSVWHEIPEEEAQEIIARMEAEADD